MLIKRLAWRGFDPVQTVVQPDEPLPDTGDIYLLGGGEDGAQTPPPRAAGRRRPAPGRRPRSGRVFAVCAGYQLLGTSFFVGENDDITTASACST